MLYAREIIPRPSTSTASSSQSTRVKAEKGLTHGASSSSAAGSSASSSTTKVQVKSEKGAAAGKRKSDEMEIINISSDEDSDAALDPDEREAYKKIKVSPVRRSLSFGIAAEILLVLQSKISMARTGSGGSQGASSGRKRVKTEKAVKSEYKYIPGEVIELSD